MRSCFVHVENSVENKKVRVPLLKAVHILGQALGSNGSIRRANARIVLCTDLNYVLVKTLALIRGSHHGLGG